MRQRERQTDTQTDRQSTNTTDMHWLSTQQESAASRTAVNGTPPFNIPVTLPLIEPALYAVILEVHDVAGNVAYARRFIFYDNSSRLLVNVHSSVRVASADPAVNLRWQTDLRDVCVDWKGRYYNDGFLHFNYLLPARVDMARDIRGVYEQPAGLLSADGTPSVRGVVHFEVRVRRVN